MPQLAMVRSFVQDFMQTILNPKVLTMFIYQNIHPVPRCVLQPFSLCFKSRFSRFIQKIKLWEGESIIMLSVALIIDGRIFTNISLISIYFFLELLDCVRLVIWLSVIAETLNGGWGVPWRI